MQNRKNVNRIAEMPQIDDRTQLGMGMLIAESETGEYDLISAVGTLREAREIAQHNLRRRMSELETSGEPMCPARYVVWSQGNEGDYRIVAEILPE
jgi:hypothetical protein